MVMEHHLHNEVRAKTLFATHYHELTALADHFDDVANVHVADLADVPNRIAERTWGVLDRFREETAVEARGSASEHVQAWQEQLPTDPAVGPPAGD